MPRINPEMTPEHRAAGRRLADVISEALHAGTGFALLIFDFGEGGNLSYISNAQREDMLRAMREFIDKHMDG